VDDPRSSAWASLKQQGSASQAGAAVQEWHSGSGQQQQQQQPQCEAEWQVEGSTSGELVSQTYPQQLSTDVQLLPVDADETTAAAAASGFAVGAGVEPSSLSLVSAVSASTAAAVAIAAAAAVAGPEFGSPELSPGSMLGQRLGEWQRETACMLTVMHARHQAAGRVVGKQVCACM
jgi:hypothetical protein